MFILLSTDQSSDDEEYQVESEIKSNEFDENEDSDDTDFQTGVENSNVNWRDNLAQKARNAYLERQSNTTNLMKIVYGAINAVCTKYK